jgi:hypothetical protein
MKLLQSLLEMDKQDAFKALVDAVENEYGKDRETSERIAKWISGNSDDDAVEEILYQYYFDEMPYGTQKARTGDPLNWISDRVSHDFKKELAAL